LSGNCIVRLDAALTAQLQQLINLGIAGNQLGAASGNSSGASAAQTQQHQQVAHRPSAGSSAA
jgi:hypothetical protein